MLFQFNLTLDHIYLILHLLDFVLKELDHIFMILLTAWLTSGLPFIIIPQRTLVPLVSVCSAQAASDVEFDVFHDGSLIRAGRKVPRRLCIRTDLMVSCCRPYFMPHFQLKASVMDA
jgi:hypothetical protein